MERLGVAYRKLAEWLGSDRVLLDEPMSRHTTFKIGGPADLYYEAQSADELIAAVAASKSLGVSYLVLGGGSNILVGDLGFRGIVIKNRVRGIERLGETELSILSGTLLTEAISFSIRLGLSGLEYLTGIPGTVGGAIRHNARFRDPSSLGEYYVDFYQVKDRFINDLVIHLTIIQATSGDILEVGNEYLQSTYQESQLRRTGDIIISSILRFQKERDDRIQENIRVLREWRKQRYVFMLRSDGKRLVAQPEDQFTKRRSFQPHLPSAGCTFANVPNPENHPTGRMIDMCGLRGKRIGGAMIALEHANFIVNVGGATAKDVMNLIELCKEKVYERFGVVLRGEIELVGEF
jgi:UDP-N-acetylmuramate dehydrogenase